MSRERGLYLCISAIWARQISVADAFDDFLACLTFFDPVTLGIIF
jgi:hypothetical protein